jgi:hypothetical protein
MSSTTTDFSKQVKKMSSDINISINTIGDEYSQAPKNQYKRQLTIDLSGGKTATNLVCFVFDHYDLVYARKSALNFCDLRVYSDDMTVEYPHYVQSYNTKYCVVFVKFPSVLATNTTTNIWITYGNVSLASKSDYKIVSTKLGSDDLLYALRANECWEFANYYNRQGTGAYINVIKNHGQKNNLIGYSDVATAVILVSTDPSATVNNLPVIQFTGTQTLPETYPNNETQQFKEGYSTFIVAKSATQAGYTSLVRFQDGGGYIVPIYWDSATSTLTSVNDREDIISSRANVGAVNNAWNILTSTRQKNTTGGLKTYRNSVLVDSENTTNLDLSNSKLWIGSFQGTAQYSNADLAETLIFNSYLSDTERGEIETYLNLKYRIDDALLPVLTLGAEQANTNYINVFRSFAPFSSWDSQGKLEQKTWGLAGQTATANLMTMMSKTIASGTSVENWNLSELDTTRRIPSEYARRRVVTTTPSNDICNIYTSLDNYTYTNLAVSPTIYTSDTDDFIEFNFWCENASLIDTTNSYIEAQNADGSAFKRGRFSSNINPLTDGLNLIKIKKSDFIFSPSWASVSVRIGVRIVTLSGTQEVLYNNFRLTQNVAQNDYYQIQNTANLRNCVSSDNDATYFNRTVVRGRITSQELSDDNIKFNVRDYLDIIKDKTFGELNSFQGYDSYTWWISNELASFSNKFEITLAFCIERIMSLIMSDYTWQLAATFFDTITPASGNTVNFPNKMTFLTIYKTDKIGDVLTQLLENNLGYLSHRPNSATFYAGSGVLTLAYDESIYPSILSELDNSLIYKFTTVSGETADIINQITFTNYNSNQFYNSRTLCQFQSDKDLEIAANATTQLFFNLSDFEQTENRKLRGNIRVASFDFSTTRGTNTFNNTGIRVKSCRMLSNTTWVVDFVSTAGFLRYLRNIKFTADFMQFDELFYDEKTIFNKKLIYDNPDLSIENGRVVLKNSQSITKYGKNNLTLGNFGYQGVEENATDIYLRISAIYPDLLARLSKPSNFVEIECQYQETYRVGQIMRFQDKSKKKVIGFIVKCEHYSSPDSGFVSNLRFLVLD